MSKIYSCVADIMGEVGAIVKSRRNSAQGFNFRGIDDVYNRLHPLLVKHRCFLSPEVLTFDQVDRPTKSGGNQTFTRMKIRYKLYADDGSFVTADVVGEAQDSADKSSAKAQSIAYKIAMFSLFCIPTEELPDPDADEGEVLGDPTLTMTIKKAIVGATSLDKLGEFQGRYESRKSEGKLSADQCAEIDLAIADKIRALAGAK